MKLEIIKKRTVRDEILDHISDYPGISFNSIQKAFKLSDGTLRYHLDHLIRTEKIKQTDKGERKYYSIDGSCKRRIEGLSKEQIRVLMVVKSYPSISNTRLRKLTGLDRAATKKVIRKLVSRQFIIRTGSRKDPCYEYISEEALAGEMMAIIMEKTIKGEIDRRTFKKLKAKIEEMRSQ
jgi:DNA-binding MarR family transcriptional regulator